MTYLLTATTKLARALFTETHTMEVFKMHNYNIDAQPEQDKYKRISYIKAAGAILTAVSGCGTGYYIQLDATPEQVHIINERLRGCA